jgi:hypothetical protein
MTPFLAGAVDPRDVIYVCRHPQGYSASCPHKRTISTPVVIPRRPIPDLGDAEPLALHLHHDVDRDAIVNDPFDCVLSYR